MTQRALARRASGDIVTLWLFDRLATGSEGASITFTPSETNYLYWISMRITGASATPFDVKSENNGAGTTATLTGITLAETEELVLAAVANYNSPTNTNPSGFTDLQNEADVLEAWYRGDLGAGATGNFTSTQGSDSWAAVLAGYKSTGGGGAAYVRPKLIVPNQAVHRASRW